MATETTYRIDDVMNRWTPADAAELYEVPRWGKGYVSVDAAGHLLVHPDRRSDRSVDLKQLVDRLRLRGIQFPVLIRFNGIIRDRMERIRCAFERAIADCRYSGRYAGLYPIKVNQQRHVVEQVVDAARSIGFGLEAGSKPELLAVIAVASPEMPIVCNGFKDAEYIEMALMARQLGRHVTPVVERFAELPLILETADRLGLRPRIGVRVKLASRGSGRWESSGGHRSKFGLTIAELMKLVELLAQRDQLDAFRLLHFHIGSQVSNIRRIKRALNEAARIYVDLVGQGLPVEVIDVGGGLGVDYDGSNTDFHSSMNYTLQEYANDVVYHIQTACDDAGVPHPDIYSESGRAMAAHHCVLVFDVLGESAPGRVAVDLPSAAEEETDPALKILHETLAELSLRHVVEAFHDAQQAIDTVMNLFATGHLSLRDRARGEAYFWAICRKIRKLVAGMDDLPEDLEALDRILAHTYFCNFSLFQSMPDSWAIHQLFPVMPIHRLGERPTRHAVLADITCDSDGKIDRFIHRRDIKRTLHLHALDGRPYYLAAFLVGAYQEILGDLHNLFGDTNAVHVDFDEACREVLVSVIKGDTVAQVLDYVQFERDMLLEQLQSAVEQAVRGGRIDQAAARRILACYEKGLNSYTYLDQATCRTAESC